MVKDVPITKSFAARRYGFLLVFTLIYFLLNYIFWGRLFDYFELSGAVLIAILATISFPVGMQIQSAFNNGLSFIILRITQIYFAAGGIGVAITILVELFRVIFRLPLPNDFHYGHVTLTITILLSLIALIAGGTWVTRKHKLISNKLDKDYKIVHLTDQHLQGVYAKRKFEKVFTKALKEKPDIIVITGDLFDTPGIIPKNTLELTKKTKIPILLSFGNHDFYVGEDTIHQLLKNSNITPLQNKLKTIQGINIIGINDSEDKTHVTKELPNIKYSKDKFNILLYHRPWGYKHAAQNNIDLMLCGHTHGGQVWPMNMLTKLAHKYVRGMHTIDNMKLYVNTGSGTWGPPMRLGSWNQITVLELKKK